MHNDEWSLMVESEGIEEGDSLLVEDEDGSGDVVTYGSVEDNQIVAYDSEGETRYFFTDTLEEVTGSLSIVGKAD